MSLQKKLELLGQPVLTFVQGFGNLVLFAANILRSIQRDGIRTQETLEQMIQIGLRSSGVILLTSTFTGLVFALQSSYAFRLFQAEALIGPSVVLSLTREISAVFTGLMVTGRAGSAMTTELGTMRVTEQIDALQTMAVSPMAYLVVPRVLATTLMLPILTMIFTVIGTLGAYYIAVYVVGVNEATFTLQIADNVDLRDLLSGLIKAFCFGFLIALICTSRGYAASGGAKGVGLKTTEAVVLSSVVILVSDYFLTVMIFGI